MNENAQVFNGHWFLLW